MFLWSFDEFQVLDIYEYVFLSSERRTTNILSYTDEHPDYLLYRRIDISLY